MVEGLAGLDDLVETLLESGGVSCREDAWLRMELALNIPPEALPVRWCPGRVDAPKDGVGGGRCRRQGAHNHPVAGGVFGDEGGDDLAEASLGFIAGNGVTDGLGDDETDDGWFFACFGCI